ncbi:hypothetical protein N4T77_14845 [Clostridium sp. CX1]|uniref:hypothetical protein n=1 Tax=Clostridium sp. CX1 TaxID=2978346 RepID=UPI0021BF4522|nr:hypothetical protein [Clostridium sp. CX1]MCT8977875.1 hypothetical protein [Clostridium sp. CX1]
MNRELIITVRDLINKHGQEIYTNSKKLRAFLNDYYPEQYTREKRLMVDSVDQKIPEIIIDYSGTEIDNLIYINLVKKLYDNLGVSQDLAEITVQGWCQIFDKTFVRFGNMTQNPINNPWSGGISSNSQGSGPYGSNGMPNGNVSNGMMYSNMNNSQVRPGVSMNANQQGYEGQTVFMDPMAQNNSQQPYKSGNSRKIIIGAVAVMIVAVIGIIGFFSSANKGAVSEKNVAAQATTTETKTEGQQTPKSSKQEPVKENANNSSNVQGKQQVKTDNDSNTTNINTTEQQITYNFYKNSRYEFSVEYPGILQPQQLPANGDGIRLSTPDGSTELVVSGINNVLNYTSVSLYNELLEEIGSVSYKQHQDNWFVVSWVEGDRIVYEKCVVGNGSINSFIFKYPVSKKDYYDSVVSHLNSSFNTPGINDYH